MNSEKIMECLGSSLTNQNSTQKEIKFTFKAGNSCYCPVQTHLSSRLLSKNLKIKMYKTIILSVVLYGSETWSLTLREEFRLKVFVVENRILRTTFGPKSGEGSTIRNFIVLTVHGYSQGD